MCGIVGYVGRRPGKPIILDGLRRLEYRGYDSAGIALIEPGGIDTVRAVGNLDALFAAAGENGSEASVGLGHTRWATHGRPSEENAHPHSDCSGRVSIVLNGIVENYKELRARLTERGHTFTSETDAEVVAHLIEEHAGEGLTAAVRAALGELEGHYAFCAVSADEPDVRGRHAARVPARRRRRRRRDVLRLGHPGVPVRTRAGWSCSRTATSSRSAPTARSTPTSPATSSSARRWSSPATTTRPRRAATRPSCSRRSTSSRRPCATRSPAACARTAPSTSPRSGMGDEFLRRLRRIFIVACGTSYHAGLIVSYAIEQLARVPVQIDVASEFRYRQPVFDPDTLVIGITQSGETADTLAAMRLAREAGSPVLALTNIMGSQATRDADYVLFTRAGLEIGVAATKTHTAQVAALLLLALRLAWARGAMAEDELKRARARAAHGARAGRAAARPPERHQADRRALPRRALLPLPRPRHGLRRLPRGRAQAQGDQLHPHRGLRRRRDEARPDRAARRRSRPSWSSPTTGRCSPSS